MRFYNRQHRHYCGIDLHVKTMYVCILDAHRPGARAPQRASRPRRPFSRWSAPYRDDLVVAAECMFTWYWLADVCAAEGITFVLGHALAMKAIHGGKAKNDKIDSHKIASLLRGRPAAAGLRLSRRHAGDAGPAPPAACIWCASAASSWRTFKTRARSTTCRRSGGGSRIRPIATACVEHFPDPSVRKSIDVDLALIDQYDTPRSPTSS